MIFNRVDNNGLRRFDQGTGSLVQQGAGTTVLTGSNTYSGGTLINNGALADRQRRHESAASSATCWITAR